jgi:hypothetical protein
MPDYLEGVHAKPGMGASQSGVDDWGMASDQQTQQGDRPQWLGSLVRQGTQTVAQGEGPVFAEGESAQWLGSVARRESEGIEVATFEPETPAAAPVDATTWTGSPVRTAVFSAPEREIEPEVRPSPVRELPQRGRTVMGALGMTLRVAA